jgi:hypothetical protein
MKGWVALLGLATALVSAAPLVVDGAGMLTPWELEEETVRPATPVEIRFEVLDDEKNVVYPLDGGAAEGRITPGSEDQVARLLSPYVLGLQEGESMRTAQLDNPFGEPHRYEIQRTIWTGNKTQTIDASAVDHVPVGEEFVVEPINITAVLVERGESTAKVEYQISDSTILHPSNLNLSVTSDEGNVRIALDHEEGETLKLRDGCRDLLGIPAGWFRFDRVDRSHAYVTYYPVQDAGTFEAAAALASTPPTSISQWKRSTARTGTKPEPTCRRSTDWRSFRRTSQEPIRSSTIRICITFPRIT